MGALEPGATFSEKIAQSVCNLRVILLTNQQKKINDVMTSTVHAEAPAAVHSVVGRSMIRRVRAEGVMTDCFISDRKILTDPNQSCRHTVVIHNID